MEERNHTFVDKFQHIRYENVTKEELEVLDYYYRRDKYIMRDQYRIMDTCLFSDLSTDDTEFTDFLVDESFDMEQEITTEMFLKELFSALSEVEKKVIVRYLLEGHKLSEVAEELKLSYRQVSRIKKAALQKLLQKVNAMGIYSYGEAVSQLF